MVNVRFFSFFPFGFLSFWSVWMHTMNPLSWFFLSTVSCCLVLSVPYAESIQTFLIDPQAKISGPNIRADFPAHVTEKPKSEDNDDSESSGSSEEKTDEEYYMALPRLCCWYNGNTFNKKRAGRSIDSKSVTSDKNSKSNIPKTMEKDEKNAIAKELKSLIEEVKTKKVIRYDEELMNIVSDILSEPRSNVPSFEKLEENSSSNTEDPREDPILRSYLKDVYNILLSNPNNNSSNTNINRSSRGNQGKIHFDNMNTTKRLKEENNLDISKDVADFSQTIPDEAQKRENLKENYKQFNEKIKKNSKKYKKQRNASTESQIEKPTVTNNENILENKNLSVLNVRNKTEGVILETKKDNTSFEIVDESLMSETKKNYSNLETKDLAPLNTVSKSEIDVPQSKNQNNTNNHINKRSIIPLTLSLIDKKLSENRLASRLPGHSGFQKPQSNIFDVLRDSVVANERPSTLHEPRRSSILEANRYPTPTPTHDIYVEQDRNFLRPNLKETDRAFSMTTEIPQDFHNTHDFDTTIEEKVTDFRIKSPQEIYLGAKRHQAYQEQEINRKNNLMDNPINFHKESVSDDFSKLAKSGKDLDDLFLQTYERNLDSAERKAREKTMDKASDFKENYDKGVHRFPHLPNTFHNNVPREGSSLNLPLIPRVLDSRIERNRPFIKTPSLPTPEKVNHDEFPIETGYPNSDRGAEMIREYSQKPESFYTPRAAEKEPNTEFSTPYEDSSFKYVSSMEGFKAEDVEILKLISDLLESNSEVTAKINYRSSEEKRDLPQPKFKPLPGLLSRPIAHVTTTTHPPLPKAPGVSYRKREYDEPFIAYRRPSESQLASNEEEKTSSFPLTRIIKTFVKDIKSDSETSDESEEIGRYRRGADPLFLQESALKFYDDPINLKNIQEYNSVKRSAAFESSEESSHKSSFHETLPKFNYSHNFVLHMPTSLLTNPYESLMAKLIEMENCLISDDSRCYDDLECQQNRVIKSILENLNDTSVDSEEIKSPTKKQADGDLMNNINLRHNGGPDAKQDLDKLTKTYDRFTFFDYENEDFDAKLKNSSLFKKEINQKKANSSEKLGEITVIIDEEKQSLPIEQKASKPDIPHMKGDVLSKSVSPEAPKSKLKEAASNYNLAIPNFKVKPMQLPPLLVAPQFLKENRGSIFEKLNVDLENSKKVARQSLKQGSIDENKLKFLHINPLFQPNNKLLIPKSINLSDRLAELKLREPISLIPKSSHNTLM